MIPMEAAEKTTLWRTPLGGLFRKVRRADEMRHNYSIFNIFNTLGLLYRCQKGVCKKVKQHL